MNLFSFEFIIFVFASFILYYLVFYLNKICKRKILAQWSILLIGSLIFYGFTNYVYLIYLGISFFVSYFTGVFCQYKFFKKVSEKSGDSITCAFKPSYVESHLSRRKYENFLTLSAILINVGILAVLKYYNFFVESINSLFNLSATTCNFIIPLGISFYTFSLVAYNVDCCKRTTKSEKNPLKFLLFVSYFPKILQGPISSYGKLKEDGLFDEHSFAENSYLKYFFRISIGLIKKIAVANVLNIYVNASYSNLNQSFGGGLLLTSIFYTIQLYCDFSGFADITIGISGLFGIRLEENFNIPYISSSIQEFWRRWHITLGAWLKKYIYIPLGGNRVSLWRWAINTLIVWLVSGIWHGANWTFVLWGLFHGILIVITGLPRQMEKKNGTKLKKTKENTFLHFINTAITFILVNFGWVLFRSASIEEAIRFYWHTIKFWEPSSYSMFGDSSFSKANWLLAVSIAFVILLIVLKVLIMNKESLFLKFAKSEIVSTVSMFILTVVFFSFSIFVLLYLNSIGGGESSFIYFDF